MNKHAMNCLIAHTPWSEADLNEHRTMALARARVAAKRSKRAADVAFFLSACLMGYAVLQVVIGKGGVDYTVPLCFGAAGLVGIVAMKLAFARTSEEAAIAQWTCDQGVQVLTGIEVDSLKKLACNRPEALQRIHSWESLGLRLRSRDRDAIEIYLRENGVDVPQRERGEWIDHLVPAGTGNG